MTIIDKVLLFKDIWVIKVDNKSSLEDVMLLVSVNMVFTNIVFFSDVEDSIESV